MDLFENFLLYDSSFGKTVKILARNHQYLGVNEAVEAYDNRKLREGKLGVFWHTQGSGKSYSMVFFTEKIRRRFSGSPTFIVLTDRDELNKQIGETYEAHRTQNGIFADNMCVLLPTASRIGFTGTPLFSYDKITECTFGSYVSIYDFKRAVDDGATVPLYYENRSELLGITNPDIDDEMLDIIEQSDLDINQRARLERDLARDYHVLTSKERLESIARDFVVHYCDLWTTGKAMFVCLDKVTAIRMYDMAQKYWAQEIERLKKDLYGATQQEYMELTRKVKWMEDTEMAVVVSQEQNEVKNFKEWGLDIFPHREKMVKRELDKEFKEPENPFRIAFVREGLDNDEELAIYDLLLKEKLSPQEIKKIKVLSQKLLESVKLKLSELDNWRDKDNTRAIVGVLIRDILWSELPESYETVTVADYTKKIYEYVYSTYPAA